MKREYLLKSHDSLACTADVTLSHRPVLSIGAGEPSRPATEDALHPQAHCKLSQMQGPGAQNPSTLKVPFSPSTATTLMTIGCSQLRQSKHTTRLFAASALFLHQPLNGSQANALGLWEIEMDIDCSTTCSMHSSNLNNSKVSAHELLYVQLCPSQVTCFSDMQLLFYKPRLKHVQH